MNLIEEKLAGIKDLVNDEELDRVKTKMDDPDRVICPLNKRYFQLPIACTGHHYVCPHLDLTNIACDHPEKRESKVS